jgi:4-amino-4-deoxy-L-arabinose transferase-like glycosyltransferase
MMVQEEHQTDRGEQRYRYTLATIIVLALVLRLTVAMVFPDQHFFDTRGYREAALHIWRPHEFNNAYNRYIMPLYPAVIALTGAGWGQLIFDIASSSATVCLIYLLSFTLFGDRAAALLAALGAALYPFFLFYSVVGLTESLFTALIVAAFLAWYRKMFMLAAIFAVLSILTRPTFDLLAPLLVLYFALVIHRLPLRVAARHLAVYVAVYCVLMAPWWVHNYQAYGTFVRLNLGSGLALHSGNNPRNQSGGVSDVQLDLSQFDAITDPVARDRALRDAAVAYIAEDPIRFLQLAGLKFMRYWRFWPFAEAYASFWFIAASLVSYVPILFLSIAYAVSCGREAFIRITPILLFAGYMTALHMVFVGSIRYRLPIEPFLIVLAAAMPARWLQHWKKANINTIK